MATTKPLAKRDDRVVARAYETASQTGVLLAVLLGVLAGAGIGLYFQNLGLGLSVAVGSSWLIASIGSASSAVERWSPLRVFLPVLFTYTSAGISLSGSDTATLEWWALVLALMGFGLGYSIAFSGAKQRAIAETPLPPSEPRVKMIFLLFAIATAVYALMWLQAGGPPALADDVNTARTQFFTSGVASTLVSIGYQVGLIVPVGLMLLREEIPHRRGLMWVAALSLLALLSLGNRGVIVGPAVILLIIALWNRALPIVLGMLLASAGLIIFSYAGFERNLTAWGSSYLNDLALAGYSDADRIFAPVLSYVSGTSWTFSQTIHLIPAQVPFQMGQQFFGPILFSPSADLFLKEALGLDFVGFGLALGFVNAFYLDWGLIGCFVGPFVFGIFIAMIYRLARFSSPAWVILIAYVLSKLLLSVYGHPFAYLAYIIAPLLIYFAAGGTLRELTPRRSSTPIGLATA
ncbi:hypothetical protein [Microbacterium memoriense]|uniref:Oligosaccharide repeat unit polymerase n=1 Tax=Microbacterium memoriense TaxID=2978350 RepID=A0ABT2PBH8_9MICO|nr:hypothetical protein [Microbacterium memoriense]MCT9001925.1 hypothetical protein [Microbacterium memoriense]